MKLEELTEALNFHVDPLKQGFNVVSDRGDIHDHYDTREEAETVKDKLNAKYGKK